MATPSAVVALILRFRRASPDERQQVRWLAYLAIVACVLLVGMISGVVAGSDGQSTVDDVLWIDLFVCVGVAFPIAIVVAIFKYRLYDLDLVIRKTVLYVTLAILLVAVFLVVGSSSGASRAGRRAGRSQQRLRSASPSGPPLGPP